MRKPTVLCCLIVLASGICAAGEGERTTKLNEFCKAQMNGLTSVEMFEKGEVLQAEGKHKEAALCFLKLLLPGNMYRGRKTFETMYPDLTKEKYNAMSKEEKEKLAAPLREYAEKTKKMYVFFKQKRLDKCLEAAGCEVALLPEHVKKNYRGPQIFKNTMEVIPEVATIKKGLDGAHIADVQYYIELAKTKTGAEAAPIHIQEREYPQKTTVYYDEFYIKCLCSYTASRNEWCQKTGASLKTSKEIYENYAELAQAYKALADNANAQYAAGNLFYLVWVSGNEDFKEYLSQSKEAFARYLELEPKGVFAIKSLVGIFDVTIRSDVAEAEKLLARIEAESPKDDNIANCMLNLVERYYKKDNATNEDREKAIALLERIQKEYPKCGFRQMVPILLNRIKKEIKQNKGK